MEQSVKDVLTVINTGNDYLSPTATIAPQISTANDTVSSKATVIIDAIMATLPDPIPPETEKTVPAEEQGWIDSLNSAIAYADTVDEGCTTAHDYIDEVIADYTEKISLHSLGATVIEEMAGGGLDKFAQAYDLTTTSGLTTMTDALAALTTVADNIPSSFDSGLIVGQMSLLDTAVAAQVDHQADINAAISAETGYKSELSAAARNYVLAQQTISWAGNEHTLAIINATGSAALNDAL